ncbi:MAG: C40 family peptidase [Bacteroidota bacterium]|nr:C40 family peptidase [Bacteroidota bacterium]
MSDFGIGKTTVIPVRATASEKAEMLSQILFGEIFEILSYNKKWSYIKNLNDNYEGWIDSKMCYKITKEKANEILNSDSFITSKLFSYARNISSKQNFIIPAGSVLPFYNKSDKSFKLLDNKYQLSSKDDNSTNNISVSEIAKQFIGAPYLWGGKSPFGIDCSGFTQIIYKILNINIPRDAKEQVNKGTEISFLDKTKEGDLVFFDNEENEIIHVGIILSENKIIHASGSVRIDKLDHQGIYNYEEKCYTHKLRIIKRIK